MVAEATARFHGSARFDEDLELSATVTRLGTTGMTTALTVARDGRPSLVEGELRHVFVDATTWTKTPIPDAVRAALAPWSDGRRVEPENGIRPGAPAQLPLLRSVSVSGTQGMRAPRPLRRTSNVRRTLVALTGATMVALALIPAAAPAATGSGARGCDPLDAKRCLLPWPNNAFTVSDVRTDTGRRVKLLPSQMPKNAKGKRIDPTDFNRADGFSPGSSILTYVPNLSLKKTGAVPVTNLRKALDRTQPIAVVNARTGARTLIWAEMDSTSKPGERLLIIHPAKNLSRGQRYIVALSNLKDTKGRLIKAPASFRVFRDQLQTKSRVQERRRLTFEKNFAALAKAGVKRKNLYLAWDFTVASTRNITERSLAIRDNAFAVLGDVNLVDRQVKGGAPRFALDAPQEFAPCGSDGCQAGESDQLARKVTGTMTVPCYLDKQGCPVGSRFRYEHLKKIANFQANRFVYVPDRIKNNTMQVPFTCIVPRAALSKPSRLALYGHAQFSGQDDVLRPDVQALAQEGDITLCAARRGRIRQRGRGAAALELRGREPLRPGRRPAAAGRRQQPHARAADDPPEGPRLPAGVPHADGRARGGHLRALLRHDLRRRVRRHGRRALTGRRARVARHRRHELQPHAPAQRELPAVRGRLREGVPEPPGPHADPVDAPGPVGPRRDRAATRRASRRTRFPTRRCTRSCSRPRSATIRCRRWRPRPRPAPSRPSCGPPSSTRAARPT